MWIWIRRSLVACVVLLVAAFLHYNLPGTDIVRVVGTETKRVDFGSNSFFWSAPEPGSAGDGITRDVFFIQTARPDGSPLVFRNEDTAWGWPPYFKFDSHDQQARAQGLVSSVEAPKWVAVRNYGWRNSYFSIFPNATSLWQVSGPDERIIPWPMIVILVLLFAAVIGIWRVWVRVHETLIDPMIDRMGDRHDAMMDRSRSRWSRIKGWFGGN